MNPPTKGHEKLVSKVLEIAKIKSADHMIYLSQIQKAGTDPLEWNFKRRVCEAAFKGVNMSSEISIKTPFQALELLCEKYDDIYFVVGSDRIANFRERMTPYAKQWGSKLSIISSGRRTLHESDVSGVSSSKTRLYATTGSKDKFMESMPSTLSKEIKNLVYRNIRKV